MSALNEDPDFRRPPSGEPPWWAVIAFLAILAWLLWIITEVVLSVTS